MKKLYFFLSLFFIFYFLFSTTAIAAPASNNNEKNAEPTEEEKNNSIIENLKNRIASRVAELKLVERRGIIGKVTDVSDTQITLNDFKNNTRFIDVDELTKFSSPSAKDAFGISDISKQETLGVLGLYNKDSKRLMARFVNVLRFPAFIHGVVKEIDKEAYTVTIATQNNEEYIFDIEQTTKTSSYSKDEQMIKSGFSKIETGKRISAIGIPVEKEKNHLTALRIIIFKDVLANPKIKYALPSPTETSAKSAKTE